MTAKTDVKEGVKMDVVGKPKILVVIILVGNNCIKSMVKKSWISDNYNH